VSVKIGIGRIGIFDDEDAGFVVGGWRSGDAFDHGEGVGGEEREFGA